MRNLLLACTLLLTSLAFSQIPAYDIYMTPLIKGDGLGYRVGPVLNVTKNPGYDNQPSYSPDGKWVYFSSIRDGIQTDIYAANTSNWLIKQITNTPESEYSPEFFSDGKAFSTVRVEMDSTQHMWQFNADGTGAKIMMPDIDSMGYYCRINNDFYALFMVSEPSTLVLVDVKNNTIKKIDSNVGRCIKMIPGENAFSYIVKTNPEINTLKKFNLATREITTISTLPSISEDYVWTNESKLLMGRLNQLWWLDYGATNTWGMLNEFIDLRDKKIFRLAISPDGKQLVYVAEEVSNR